jgi:hypothetical protein
MAGRLQLRRGTTAQNNAFTGAVGELTFDTDTNGVRVHDGHTQGGLPFNTVTEFQRPTAANTYTWYRKWSDGWVEQGGKAYTNGGNPTQITLPVEMANTNYIPFIQGETGSDGYSGAAWQVMPVDTATSPKTATRFYAQGSITGYNLGFVWRVEGMAA